MIVHTAVHHRLDVLDVWCAAMRKQAPWAELHVWYSGEKPRCGDAVHPMPHVGLAAAAFVTTSLPWNERRVFVESDMIPVRPWSLDDYPGPLRMLEGSAGKRWHGVTIAAPGESLASRPVLIPQRYIREGECPGWVPEWLRPLAIVARAKAAGDHWLHLDKMHREQGASPEKAALLDALRDEYAVGGPGLGEAVAAGLSAVGVTEQRVSAWVGGCRCGSRRRWLNRLARKARNLLARR